MKINWENKMPLVSMAFFAFVALASVADITLDLAHGAKTGHLVQEFLIVCFSLVLFFILFADIKKQKNKNQLLETKIAEIREISKKSSEELNKAKRDFGIVISKQFSIWRLTQSESDVALFLLKGFNTKEIANLRGTSEKTTRNQLSSIYLKAEVSGKQALIAWFIDDLLNPA